MAKPRVFVSSTYYDLRHIRDRLESFIESLGYEAVLFESGDIPFRHDKALDESCYAEIKLCHILVLLVGGRYGSAASSTEQSKQSDGDGIYEFYNSITRNEYETARERDIPIFIFVDKNVLAEYETFKRNKENKVAYAHVDSTNVFKLLDEILSRQRNNFVRGFERFDDIAIWLRDQWAGLFAEMIVRRSSDIGFKDLAARISELGSVASSLKTYTETMLRTSQPKTAAEIIGKEDKRRELHQIRQFRDQPLIQYLSSSVFQQHAGIKRMFSAFKSSNTLEEFLRNIGFGSDGVSKFLGEHEVPARRDYEDIRSRIFDIEDEEEDEAENEEEAEE